MLYKCFVFTGNLSWYKFYYYWRVTMKRMSGACVGGGSEMFAPWAPGTHFFFKMLPLDPPYPSLSLKTAHTPGCVQRNHSDLRDYQIIASENRLTWATLHPCVENADKSLTIQPFHIETSIRNCLIWSVAIQ